MNRSVLAARRQPIAIPAPLEPLHPRPSVRRPRRSQNQGHLFASNVPDADQTVRGAFGEPVTGSVPRHGAEPVTARKFLKVGVTLRQGSSILVRERVEVEPFPAAAVGRASLRKPFGQKLTQVPQASVFPPHLL